jgi:hypothetical protein
MSMEVTVLSTFPLDSIVDWQAAIDGSGFALRLDTRTAIAAMNGFLPARLDSKPTGFECYHDDASELAKAYSGAGLQADWTHALSFRWGGNFDEGLAAWMAATAYAAATRGVVFDPQESKVYDPSEALQATREFERSRPLFEDVLRKLKEG